MSSTVRLSDPAWWALKIAAAKMRMTPADFFDLLTAKDKRAQQVWKDAVDYVREHEQ